MPLPSINVNKLKKGAVMIVARNKCREHFWPILDAVGKERICWLGENDKRLLERLPQDAVANLSSKSHNYKCYADMITDQEIAGFLPEWFIKTVAAYGDKGNTWISNEICYIRKVFFG